MKNLTDWSKYTVNNIRGSKGYGQLLASLVGGVVGGVATILYCILATLIVSVMFLFYLAIFCASLIVMPFCFIYDMLTGKQ